MRERRITSHVCCGCACLCDDIDVTIRDGSVTEVTNVCQWGLARFTGHKKYGAGLVRRRCLEPRVRTSGGRWSTTDGEGALDAAAELMNSASRLVVYGLCQLSQASLPPLLALCRNKPTVWIPSEGPLWQVALEAYRRRPVPMTSLEEVRNQADLVLFWGANPLRSSPRLLARYALFARGRFTERGEEDRRGFAVDIQHTEMERLVPVLVVRPESEVKVVAALRAACEGGSFRIPEGISSKEFKSIVQAVEKSTYRVIFAGRGATHGDSGSALVDELCAWVEALNRQAPAFFMPMASDFNTIGFVREFVAGGGLATPQWSLLGDLRRWEPRPGDLLVAVSGDCHWFLTDDQKDALRRLSIPTVALSVYETQTTAAASVVVNVGLLGIDTRGDAFRLDGVGVPVERLPAHHAPADDQVLDQWLRRVS